MSKILLIIILINSYLSSNELKKTIFFSNKISEKLFENRYKKIEKFCLELSIDGFKCAIPTEKEILLNKRIIKNSTIIKDDYYWTSTLINKNSNERVIYDISNDLTCEGLVDSDKYYALCICKRKE